MRSKNSAINKFPGLAMHHSALIWGFLRDVAQRTGVPRRRWRNHACRSFRRPFSILYFCSRRGACFHANDRSPVYGDPYDTDTPGKMDCISVGYNARKQLNEKFEKSAASKNTTTIPRGETAEIVCRSMLETRLKFIQIYRRRTHWWCSVVTFCLIVNENAQSPMNECTPLEWHYRLKKKKKN